MNKWTQIHLLFCWAFIKENFLLQTFSQGNRGVIAACFTGNCTKTYVTCDPQTQKVMLKRNLCHRGGEYLFFPLLSDEKEHWNNTPTQLLICWLLSYQKRRFPLTIPGILRPVSSHKKQCLWGTCANRGEHDFSFPLPSDENNHSNK